MKIKLSKKVREISKRVAAVFMTAFLVLNAVPVTPVAAPDADQNEPTFGSVILKYTTGNATNGTVPQWPLSYLNMTGDGVEQIKNNLQNATYTSSNESVAIVTGGAIKAVGVGSTIVTAYIPADHDSSEAYVDCTVTVNGLEQNPPLAFDSTNKTMKYGEKLVYEPKFDTGSGEGAITYESSNSEIAVVSGGAIVAVKPGNATITATKAAHGWYNKSSASYWLTVEKGDPDFLQFVVGGNPTESASIKVGQAVPFAPVLSGNQISSIDYYFECVGIEWKQYATVDSATGAVTAELCTPVEATDPDKGLFLVMNYSGNDYYVSGQIRCKIVITPATLENFKFVESTKSIEYGDTYINSFVETGMGAVITYTSSDESVATVDGDGTVTALYPGTTTITATRAQDALFDETTCSYELTVTKATQQLTFSPDVPEGGYELLYGTEFDSPEAIQVADTPWWAEGELTYEISEGAELGLATINPSTGELSFADGKVGTITVKATKAGNDCYEVAEATYTLTVSYKEVLEGDYKVVDENGNENVDWYNAPVSVVGGDREGNDCLFSTSNELSQPDESWSEKLENVLVYDGETEVTFYIKYSDGSISDAITVAINKDSAAPTLNSPIAIGNLIDPAISEEFSVADATKEDSGVTIDAVDERSGIEKIEYLFSDTAKSEEELKSSEWTLNTKDSEGQYLPISIPENTRTYVYAKVTDKAGNVAYFSYALPVISDKKAPMITVAPTEPKENGYYSALTLNVNVSDMAETTVTSGIKEVTYTVSGGGETTNGTLYSFEEEPFKDDSVSETELRRVLENLQLVVDTSRNYGDNVKVVITATDYAGNTQKNTQYYNIDTTVPVLSVTYDCDITENGGYHNEARTAIVTVKEGNSSFRKTMQGFAGGILPQGFSVIAKDAAGEIIANPELTFGTWTTTEGATQDEAEHTLTITFVSDGAYTLEFIYTDAAGNVSAPYNASFVIDKTAPKAEISILGSKWNSLAESAGIANWSKKEIELTVSASDEVSPIASMEYYLTQDPKVLNGEQLEAEASWVPYNEETKVKIDQPGIYMLFAKVTDQAGNVTYVSTQGFLYNNSENELSLLPKGTSEGGFFTSDVKMDVTVQEKAPAGGDEAYFVGIKKIEYKVFSNNRETQSGVLYEFTNPNPTPEDIVSVWADADAFTVTKLDNDADNVVVKLIVTDNAGGIKETETKVNIAASAPVIKVDYDNSSASSNGYYNKARTATISVMSRASLVSPDEIKVVVTAKDGKGQTISLPAEKLSGWTVIENVESPNETIHRATYRFDIDGNYEMAINCTNKAELKAESYTASFTVDAHAPEMASITINERQWSSLATAEEGTITVTGDLSVYITATDSMSPVTIQYMKVNMARPYTVEELDALDSDRWVSYAPLTITSDEAFTIYAKVSDSAGNYKYISSPRYVLDKSGPRLVLSSEVPERTVTNQNVLIYVNAIDNLPSSGLQLVKYRILCDGVQTQAGNIYSYGKVNPGNDVINEFNGGSVTVNAAANNSSNVEVIVDAFDFAGNSGTASYFLNIDATGPEISISYNNNDCYAVKGETGYYAAPRTATITVKERQENFVEPVLGRDIKITYKDASGNVAAMDLASMAGGWQKGQVAGGKEIYYTGTVNFFADGEYILEFSCQDAAGNVSKSAKYGDAKTPTHFVIDQTAPAAVLKAEGFGEWSSLTNFGNGIVTNKSVVFTCSAWDNYGDTVDISYYIAEGKNSELTKTQLDGISTWVKMNRLSLEADKEFVAYVKVADAAGNTAYVRSDKFIIDKTPAAVTKLVPQTEARYKVYNDDVTINVSVTDETNTITCSGIGKITYTIRNMGVVTQEGTLFEESTPVDLTKLCKEWSGELVVNKELNNSNDVEIELQVYDNAGNSVSAVTKVMLDTTKPRISISYDNNAGVRGEDNIFFRQPRTAEIAIYERNFDADNVRLSITNPSGVIPTISEWVLTEGSGSGDDNVHKANLVFDADGEYTITIDYVDMAGNAADSELEYGDSVAPTSFAIDVTKPEIIVTYDNNESLNGMYYAAERWATIAIRERNFAPDKTEVWVSKDGEEEKAYIVWDGSDGYYESALRFYEDGVYTIEVLCEDLPGNQADAFKKQEFCIDTTAPTVTVTGIVDNSANATSEPIGFVVEATDVNPDVFELELSTVLGTEKKVVPGEVTDFDGGHRFTIYDVTEDGIYRLFGAIADKAGNKYKFVNLTDTENVAYEKEIINNEILKFSVNRNGSSFQLNEETVELVSQYYLKDVNRDIVIEEVNVDNLEEYSVFLNGTKLRENIDFTVVRGETANAWSIYTYTISHTLFEQEGRYSIVVGSVDKASSSAYSDMKNNEVIFTIDRTPPVFKVSGLKEGGRYQVEKQIISIIPQDDGGLVTRLSVVITDSDGDVIKKYEWKDEELQQILETNSNTVTAEIPTGLNMNVTISCSDGAYNEEGVSNTYEKTYQNVTVSNEWNVIFFANKPLFFGVIGGGTLLAALGVGAVVIRKRKKKVKRA